MTIETSQLMYLQFVKQVNLVKTFQIIVTFENRMIQTDCCDTDPSEQANSCFALLNAVSAMQRAHGGAIASQTCVTLLNISTPN